MSEHRPPFRSSPDDPETARLLREAAAGPEEGVTTEECLACAKCPLCHGKGVVPPELNVAWTNRTKEAP